MLSPGRAQRRAGTSRPPNPGSTPADGGTISALLAVPPGARPTSGGSRQWSVPPPPSQSSCRHTSARSTHTPHAWSVSNKHAKRTGKRGACTLSSRRFRPYAGCRARWPSRWSRREGDLPRFAHPTALMPYLGWTPSEDTRGERRRHGAITTAGNTPARRVLVEGAWAYRDPAHVSRHLQRRLENPSHLIQAIR